MIQVSYRFHNSVNTIPIVLLTTFYIYYPYSIRSQKLKNTVE